MPKTWPELNIYRDKHMEHAIPKQNLEVASFYGGKFPDVKKVWP